MEEEAGAEGEGGAVTGGNWYDTLPEDMREDQNITKFDSVESLSKSWLNAQRLIGADKIPMPQTDDDWGNVFNKLGRPEDASGYAIEPIEGVEVNAEMQTAFLEKAHEIGLLPNQVQELAQWQMQQGLSGQEASNQALESSLNEKMDALKTEWGQAFDQNAGIAQRAISEFATDADKDFMNNAVIDGVKVGDHPAMARLFHNIGKSMMETGKLEGVGSEQAMTPSDMQDKIDSLMGHPAYTDRKHPEHRQVAKQVTQLFQQKYG
jgi:hypothetical protein